MKILKKFLSAGLAFAICFSFFGYNIANAQENTSVYPGYLNGSSIRISDYLTKDDLDFMKKLEKVYPYFEFDSKGALILTKEISEIKRNFNFDDDFVYRMNRLLQSDIAKKGEMYAKGLNKNSRISAYGRYDNAVKPMVHVSNWKVYFTYEEVMASFFAAAQVGPAAIVAALASLGTAIGGPVGAAIGTIVGYISGADFLYLVLRAATLKKGIYIGLDWDGPYPVPTQGTW